jgi:hypothetical protein
MNKNVACLLTNHHERKGTRVDANLQDTNVVGYDSRVPVIEPPARKIFMQDVEWYWYSKAHEERQCDPLIAATDGEELLC